VFAACEFKGHEACIFFLPKCTGKIKIIAAIEDPKVIKQILEHLGLPSSAPRLMQAHGPPQTEQSDFFAQGFYED